MLEILQKSSCHKQIAQMLRRILSDYILQFKILALLMINKY